MRAYVDYELGRLDANGLSSSSLGDWAAPGFSQRPAPEDRALTSTAFVHRATALLGEIASVLGNYADAGAYAARADRIERDFNAAFLDPAAGLYRTAQDPGYRQTSNALPLAWGLVPAEHRADVLANLVDDVVGARDGHLNTGAIGTKHLLRVLTDGGHADVAHTIATQTTYPSWGNWFVNAGGTTPFEFWENDARSRGHMFLGTILDWFYADLAGLRTERIGADGTLEVRPYPVDGLDRASAWTETPYGRAAAAWRRTKRGRIELEVTVPVGARAEVHVPAADAEHVTENGKPWTRADGVRFVRMTDRAAVFAVGSGSYEFATGA
jgi:alpha-L-rhamnosidase